MSGAATIAVEPEAVAHQKEAPNEQVAKEKSLWRWNLAMGILHLVQAIACVVIGSSGSTTASKFKLPQTTDFIVQDPVTGFFQTKLETRYYVPFVALTSGFAFMSSAAHFLVILFFKRYVQDLRAGINRIRWFEYAASSSLMIVLVAQLCGVYNIFTLFALGCVNATMNLFGYNVEVIYRLGNKAEALMNFIFGCFAGIVPWAIIFSHVSSWDSSRVPGFVKAVIASYVILFLLFPINMGLQYQGSLGPYKSKKWSNEGYYFGEKVYQILSLVAKSLLLWLVVGGSNQPNEFTGNTGN